MNYLEKTQKEITLPSGAKVTVRRQTKLEAVLIGRPPACFMRDWKLREAKKEVPESTPAEDEAVTQYLAKQNRIVLTRCCVTPLRDGESELRIVDKEPGKEDKGEISWALILDEDVNAIIEASNSLSMIGATAGEAVKTFPEGEKVDEGNGRNGEALPLPAIGTPAPVS